MTPESELSEKERDVLTLVSIAQPLPLRVIQEVLGVDDTEASALVDGLASTGAVEMDRTGVRGRQFDASPARESMLAGRLLEVLDRTDGPAVLIAPAAWRAGDARRSFTEYQRALADTETRSDELLGPAIDAGVESGAEPGALAALRVLRSRSLRNRGASDAALADIEAAVPDLDGADLVDALAFAAAIEDDRQHPADAERFVAMGMLVAANGALGDKLGSLATLHGRVLARLGFEAEADASFARGLQLIAEHGSDVQMFYGSLNEASTAFDRGWMSRAEHGFATTLRTAERIESRVSAADKEIALARAKFGSGDPSGAVACLDRARIVAAAEDAPALGFLIAIAEAEGSIAYERIEDARAAIGRLDEIVAAHFPAWIGRAASLRARLELLAGDKQAASRAVEVGLEATPDGANGNRLRAELSALGMAASQSWNSASAAELADRIIQAGWLGLAAWFTAVRADRDDDAQVGMIAAALAHRLGNPMQAARAIEAADAWDDPRAGAIALAVDRVAKNMPDGWSQEFRALSHVDSAMSRAGQNEHASDTVLMAGLDAALKSAGLSGVDAVLSPAQRRAAGLIAAPSRVRSALRWIAPIVGAAAVAAIVAVLVAPEPLEPVVVTVPTPVSVPIPTTIPDLDDRIIEPEGELFGQSPHVGGETRNAVYEAQLGEPTGIYWRQPVTGFVRFDPVLQGKALYVGTSQGFVSAFDIANDGSVIFEDQQNSPIVGSFIVEQVSFGEGGEGRSFLFYGDEAGVLRMRNIDDQRGLAWEVDLGSPITGPPLVRSDFLIVATTEGFVYKLGGADGVELTRYPANEPVEGGFADPMAAADGSIYVRTSDGRVQVIDEASMSLVCEVAMGAAEAVTHPVVSDDRWFVGTSTRSMFSFALGTCGSGGGIPAFQIDVPIRYAPPIADGIMWNDADGLLLPIDLSDGQIPFTASNLEATITSPPVIVGDLVLVGATRGGRHELVAVSRTDGLPLWRFPLDQPLRTRPVVGDGIIIVATDLELIAIAAPPG